MKNTLAMMKENVKGYEKDMPCELLMLEYWEKQSPNILAFYFVQNYGLIQQISSHFNLLTMQDKASFSLQELDHCLRTFDKNKGWQFNTYFGACLKNRLRHEQQFLTTDLQKANYITQDLAEYQQLEDPGQLDYFDLENYGLTTKELYHCKLIINRL